MTETYVPTILSNETTIQGVSLTSLYTSLNLTACPDNVYSEDQKNYRVYANLPISLFGILSNVINIIVFSDLEMRTMLVNHFLLALGISDLVLLICNLFFLILPVIVLKTDSFFWNDLFPVIIRYSYPFALTAQTAGVYLTVLVSVHRFLGVCYPFKAKRWVTRRPVQIAIIGSIVFSILINVPTFFELYVAPCYSERFKKVSRQIALSEFHEITYILIKKTIIYTITMFVLPFGTLIFVNWRIVLAMRESANLRTRMNSNKSADQVVNQSDMMIRTLRNLKSKPYAELFQTLSKMSNSTFLKPSTEIFKTRFTNSWKDKSVTLMLLAIVALFLLLNGLAFCNSIIESVMLIRSNDSQDDTDANLIALFESSVELSNVLISLNSSTSILVYVVFSSKYRQIIKSLCGLEKRVKLNRIALSTGLAANRMAELSLIPDEIERRRQSEKIVPSASKRRRGTDAACHSSNGIRSDSSKRRKKIFRTQTISANSEFNLRLVDNNHNNGLISKRSSTSDLPGDNVLS